MHYTSANYRRKQVHHAATKNKTINIAAIADQLSIKNINLLSK
ncbi:hypothetical protein BN1221_01742c [Brenneria goodwinii]|uniref:Uncharacterized protein n=1 Tax=Brenneria goodwinii TaxID=1109412 RepID=A0A0G4JTN0_9GAMM|nr:hypothetical protein BN1221_01742c [Brenneria goodwinii]